MVGYVEALTDPSYRGQILVLTFPMIGNYGVPSTESRDDVGNASGLNGLPTYLESDRIHVAGLIVTDYSADFSHWNAAKSLGQWLTESGIPALFGVDTRKLTKKIREYGTMQGRIDFGNEADSSLPPIPPSPVLTPATSSASLSSLVFPLTPRDSEVGDDTTVASNGATKRTHPVAQVTCKEIKVYGQGYSPRIIAFDCGMKHNIIRCFVREQQAQVTVVPFDYDLASNPAGIQYEGIFISNGPGDPQDCVETIASIQWAMTALDPPKPIFGICLGNQILGLACGAKTYKMKYGNRGMNQPLHRPADHEVLHHLSEPRLCGGLQLFAGQGVEDPLSERQRSQQRRHHPHVQTVLQRAVPSGGLRRPLRHQVPVHQLHRDGARHGT